MATRSQDDITIRIMTKDDFPRVNALLKDDFFSSEPLSQCNKEPRDRQAENRLDDYHLSMIAQGTCLVALDESNSGRLVGFVLAGAQVPEDIKPEQTNWSRIRRILSKIERDANVFERYGISKVLLSHITSVEASMRGRGLGSRLASRLMDLGREKGFPVMVAYCTSFYSARHKESLGMECIYSLVYADYKDESGRPIFTPAAPHTMARVLAIKL